MENAAHIGDLTSVSFVDFETKSSDPSSNSSKGNNGNDAVSGAVATTSCFGNYTDYSQTRHEINLNLSLAQKADGLFEADQTPTPTRLIKNCDEVGLFEDLRHMNPFDIGFQRAVEQNAVGGHSVPVTPTRAEAPHNEGDSLHTPQVYPMDNSSANAIEFAKTSGDSNSPLDVPVAHVDDLLTPVAPKTALLEPLPTTSSANANAETSLQQTAPLHLLQPQVITWVLPAQAVTSSTITVEPTRLCKQLTSAIPVQTVRPFILPKPKHITNTSPAIIPTSTANNKAHITNATTSTQPAHEPSSASLTPTSQLPIKERLKAILNNSSSHKQRSFIMPQKPLKSRLAAKQTTRTEDCMERRRAAATRYRNKMRNEHKELKQHNTNLLQENRQLRERIALLEQQLQSQKQQPYDCNNNSGGAVSSQIQIPPSSIHLVINVPKMIVPSGLPHTMPSIPTTIT